MNNSKQLIEKLEKITGKKVTLKEGFEIKTLSSDDSESVIEMFEEEGLIENQDYKAEYMRGDDIPYAFTALTQEAQNILDQFEEGEY